MWAKWLLNYNSMLDGGTTWRRCCEMQYEMVILQNEILLAGITFDEAARVH